MAKKRPGRKPKIFNWIVRGYNDFLKGTPFAHAPSKDIATKPKDTLSPEEEQYLDGLNSAKLDQEQGYTKP